MSNPLYYVLGLLLATLYPIGVEPLRFAREEVGLPAAMIAVVGFGIFAWSVHRGLTPARVHRLGLARLILRWVAMVLYAALLYVFHFPLWVWTLGLENSVFFGPLVTLTPLLGFFSILALLGAVYDPRREGPLAGTLAFALRGFAGFSLLPIVLMLTLQTAVVRIEPLRRLTILYPAAGLLFSIGCMLLFVSVLPLLLRMAFRARPLPPGPLREGLEAICRRGEFRCAELLVLPTGGARMANAFIVGLAAPIRCVFFTDSIVAGMSPESLECVLAHEIAHSRRRHILTFLAATLGFMLLSAAALDVFEELEVSGVVIALFLLGWGALFWVGVFGWVSRRFESEADLAAARLAPPVESPPYGAALKMAEALRRVGELNRISPWAWSWRHFSIEKRIDLLLDAREDPRSGEAFEGRCRRWRKMAVLVFVLGLGALGFLAAREHAKVDDHRSDYEAEASLERGEALLADQKVSESLERFRNAVRAGADRAEIWLRIARCERLLGREEEARRAENVARTKPVTDPRARLRIADLAK